MAAHESDPQNSMEGDHPAEAHPTDRPEVEPEEDVLDTGEKDRRSAGNGTGPLGDGNGTGPLGDGNGTGPLAETGGVDLLGDEDGTGFRQSQEPSEHTETGDGGENSDRPIETTSFGLAEETQARGGEGLPIETLFEPAAEDDEQGFDLLGDLIASIDREILNAFGAGPMVDPEPRQDPAEAQLVQHVVFSMAGMEYAVPVENVTEIGRPMAVTRLPNVPEWLLGLANLRGEILSVVDLRAFLGMEPRGINRESRMLVAQAYDEQMRTGIIVDQVKEIRHLAVENIGDPTARIEDRVTPYLRGVYLHQGRLLAVLDLNRMLLSEEMQQFDSALG